jgi:tRNA threonylcarbamoyladenosine biosynthesis protein TsaB
MLCLVIETATAACSVALIKDGNVIASQHETVGRGHAERLIPMIADLPNGGRADQIFVGCGPGSFTGVRVGIAAARGLGIGWNVPVQGFSTLALIAAGGFAAWPDTDTLGVVIEGGHGELFVQHFRRDPFTALDDLQSLPLDKAVAVADAYHVVGNAAHRIVESRGNGSAKDIQPMAAQLIHVPTPLTSLKPTPIYGRAPDAKPIDA